MFHLKKSLTNYEPTVVFLMIYIPIGAKTQGQAVINKNMETVQQTNARMIIFCNKYIH
jgi:hypothetical protein